MPVRQEAEPHTISRPAFWRVTKSAWRPRPVRMKTGEIYWMVLDDVARVQFHKGAILRST